MNQTRPAKRMKSTYKTGLMLPGSFRPAASTPVHIRPFEDQLPKLRAIAASEGIDVSDVMRQAFDLKIEAHEIKDNLEKA